MKMIFSLIVTTVLLFSQTINEQIHALEKASPEKRVELMNSIKRQLISMNQEKRMKTINALQKKLQVKNEQTPANDATHEEVSQEDGKEEASSHTEDGHHKKQMNSRNLERHEMQEQMMNCTHTKDVEHHQSAQNYESFFEEGRSTEWENNQDREWNNNRNGSER